MAVVTRWTLVLSPLAGPRAQIRAEDNICVKWIGRPRPPTGPSLHPRIGLRGDIPHHLRRLECFLATVSFFQITAVPK